MTTATPAAEGRGAARAARGSEVPPLPEALGVAVYDDHTHLDPVAGTGADALDPDQALADAVAALDDAEAVGVRGIVQVGTDLESSRWSADLAEADARVLAAVALHPNEAPRLAEAGVLDAHLAEIEELAARPRVRAIGETGLDFFRTAGAGLDAQRRSLEAHVSIAKAHGLALQIHDRDAHDAVVETLLRLGAPERTVFHCFSGDEELARVCADHGWYLSIAGTVTFKNAPNIRRAVAVAPADLLLVETDAPYLTPAPHRGRRNAPALIPLTLRAMAEVRDEPVDGLAAAVAANSERVYGAW